MTRFFLCTFLALTATLLNVAHADKPKPRVIAILAHSDEIGLETFKKYTTQLRNCGFEVPTIEKKDGNGVEEALELLKPRPGDPIFLDAHGQILNKKNEPVDRLEQGEFHFGDKTKMASGQSLVKKIHTIAPGSQLWVETCHGAACFKCDAGSVGMGASCEEDEWSIMQSDILSTLADLYCSRLKGCEEWNKADKNRDGKITPEELTDYLFTRYKRTERSKDWNVKNKAEGEEAEKICKSKRGTISKETLQSYNVEYTLEPEPGGPPPSQVNISLFEFMGDVGIRSPGLDNPDEAEVIQLLKKSQKRADEVWPERWGSQKIYFKRTYFSAKRTNFKLTKDGAPYEKWTCKYVLPEAGQKYGARHGIRSGTYTVFGPECAKENTGNAATPHSGETPPDMPTH